MLAVIEPALCRFLASLKPSAKAFFPVSWAGENVSFNWFDVAREYTERWHHQEQIREAVGASPLTRKRFLGPVLDTLLRALPFWYEEVQAEPGTVVQIRVTGKAGGVWCLFREKSGWRLSISDTGEPSAASVTLSEDIAWKILTRSMTPSQARPLIICQGDQRLSKRFLEVKAIMMND